MKRQRSAPAVLFSVCLLGAACVPPPPAAPPPPPPAAPAAAQAAPPSARPPAAQQPRYDADVERRIDRIIHGLLPNTALSRTFGPPSDLAERMRHYHTPGVSIAVINGGKIEWARGFGVRDVETGEPVTPETMFQAASISKPVFALAVVRLVEQGKLSLDEDVNHVLRSWKVPPSGEWQPTITLRMILSHSAGMTVHGFDGYRADEPIPTVTQILDGAPPANSPAVRVDLLPGTRFRYAGGGLTVAQLLVCDVLGEAFPAIMARLVIDPLGMAHSTYEQPLPERFRGIASTAYPWKRTPLPGRWHTYPEMAAAGLWTTPSDLARVGIEVQRAMRGESSFLSKPMAEQMLTRQMEDLGLGFFLEGDGETIRFGHGGWNEGFVSRATFYGKLGKGAVVMINSNEGDPMRTEIERAIAREYAWPEYFEPERTRANVDEAALDRLAGEYESENGIRLAVARRGKDLTITVLPRSAAGGVAPAGGAPVRLIPYEPAKFFAPGLDLEVWFEVRGRGRAWSLALHQETHTLDARRKP